MTDTSNRDVLGLGGTLPGPGWIVLDAARDQRFTGELVARNDVAVRVYFDRGRIYVAERASDPPLGTRLIEAGALNQAQLDYGSLRVGDIEHLGRLFDRVPSVNRDGVLVLNELMTEECVRQLAATEVRSVVATPYRHHPSGMHRWELFDTGSPTSAAPAVPEMALPAPHPDATPVTTAPPADESGADTPAHRPTEPPDRSDAGDATTSPPERPAGAALLDDVVAWNEPSSPTQELVGARTVAGGRMRATDLLTDTDDAWIDELDHEGVTDTDVGGGGVQARLAPLPVRPVEEFELIWPSGETVDVVDTDEPPNGRVADQDRAGPTARVPTAPSDEDGEEADGTDAEPADGTDPDEPSQLAVRRAVATIDTGSLDARRRLADVSSDATAPPGRLVVQREASVWRSGTTEVTASVFDEQPVEPPEPEVEPVVEEDDHEARSNALRRLIQSLRRP